jgi:hypothetical protein
MSKREKIENLDSKTSWRILDAAMVVIALVSMKIKAHE